MRIKYASYSFGERTCAGCSSVLASPLRHKFCSIVSIQVKMSIEDVWLTPHRLHLIRKYQAKIISITKSNQVAGSLGSLFVGI